jgi:hypothetical protein
MSGKQLQPSLLKDLVGGSFGLGGCVQLALANAIKERSASATPFSFGMVTIVSTVCQLDRGCAISNRFLGVISAGMVRV